MQTFHTAYWVYYLDRSLSMLLVTFQNRSWSFIRVRYRLHTVLFIEISYPSMSTSFLHLWGNISGTTGMYLWTSLSKALKNEQLFLSLNVGSRSFPISLSNLFWSSLWYYGWFSNISIMFERTDQVVVIPIKTQKIQNNHAADKDLGLPKSKYTISWILKWYISQCGFLWFFNRTKWLGLRY
jgi:hypothetical protein